MNQDDPDKKVYEPEVLPPPGKSAASGGNGTYVFILGPLLGGILIDIIDLATRLPHFGLILGAVAGYWASRLVPATPAQRIAITLAAALYCALPKTHFMPVATIAGLITAFGSRFSTK
ncbi:MAG TPA: hypothetical protein PKE55_14925 [Kiritimatiellia bacterium]|nr:hypothetical protein [Kiritimatiellia bacterium]